MKSNSSVPKAYCLSDLSSVPRFRHGMLEEGGRKTPTALGTGTAECPDGGQKDDEGDKRSHSHANDDSHRNGFCRQGGKKSSH